MKTLRAKILWQLLLVILLFRNNDRCLRRLIDGFDESGGGGGGGGWKFGADFRSGQNVFNFIENVAADVKLNQIIINQFSAFMRRAFTGKKRLQINIAVKDRLYLFLSHLPVLLFLPNLFAQIVEKKVEFLFIHSAFVKIPMHGRKNFINRFRAVNIFLNQLFEIDIQFKPVCLCFFLQGFLQFQVLIQEQQS